MVSGDLDATAIIGTHMGGKVLFCNSACPLVEFYLLLLNITSETVRNRAP